MPVLFWIFLDQICPKWIKLDQIGFLTKSKNVSLKSFQIYKKDKDACLILDFFGSDLSKMDQTCKFGEKTSRILEFKPKGLES